MRYPQAHAAKSGSIPFALRGNKSMRTALSVAVAAAVGLTPTVMFTSPAYAAPAPIVISSPTVTEGGDLQFVITRAASADNAPVSVGLALTAGPAEEDESYAATAGSDYVNSVPSTVSVTGTTAFSRTITVRTIDDALFEGGLPEVVTLTGTPAGGDAIPATGKINDNDDAPSYTLSTNSPVTEGSGSKATVTAKLSAPSGFETVISLTTTPGTAAPGENRDYTDLVDGSRTITIAAGKTSGTKDILIGKDDTRDSADVENFTVNASATASLVAAPANTSTQVSITDIDPLPKISIADDAPSEVDEDDGTLAIPLDVSLTHGSDKTVTVRWDAGAPTAKIEDHEVATPGTDFSYPASTQRTVTFNPRDVEESVSVAITDDSLFEANEDFSVQLANPTNAELGTESKTDVTIEDNDDAEKPEITIDTASVDEGNSGKASRTITAKLSKASGSPVKVNWAAAAAGTDLPDASPVKDFIPKTGSITFPAGTTTQTFAVDIVGDTIDEINTDLDGENFQVTLTGAVNATSGEATAVLIKDDDDKPKISFDDIALPEGNSTAAVLVPVKLSNASNHTLTFDLEDAGTGTAQADDTGVGGGDYTMGGGTVVVRPETTSGFGVLLLNGDMINESNETVNLGLDPQGGSDPYLSSTSEETSAITIENDDKAPEFKINDVTGQEGDTVPVTGTVTGISDQPMTVTVSFAGASGGGAKAAEAADFTNPGTQTVTVDAGTEPGSAIPIADVLLTDDEANEPNETIKVSGTSLGNFGMVGDGWVTIAASDGGKPEEPGAPTIGTSTATLTGVGNAMISGKAKAGATVDLWGKPFGAEKAVKIKSVVATPAGAYSFTHKISEGFIFQTSVGELVSKEIAVRIKQNPVLTATSPSKGNFTVTVTGNPKDNGQDILVQSWVSGTWKTVYKGKTGSNGVYSISKKLASGSSLTFRAFVAGDTSVGLLGGWSVSKKVTVK
ncbi:Calx-beta domain-containing protein [Actinoplanes sp. CA-015351]|uniref:Calx-beta domain-containing protein n=1 Tax=Actinoplanes sp. CA-015351 TaxID=3239897 RepID=UPI003D96F47E